MDEAEDENKKDDQHRDEAEEEKRIENESTCKASPTLYMLQSVNSPLRPQVLQRSMLLPMNTQ